MIPNLISIPEGVSTKLFVMGRDVIKELPLVLKESYFAGKTPWILADGNTFAAAGKQVVEVLNGAGIATPYIKVLPANPRPHPHLSTSQEFAKEFPENIVPIAVGSGVINDLTKCAAGIKGIPYICVPTACSVDGYTSKGGAMLEGGFKRTFMCPPPTAIVADVNVMEKAPRWMLSSGYGDLFSKMTGGADWIVAEVLGFEPIEPKVWALVQHPLRKNLSDCNNIEFVFEGLAATGYSMQMYRDSRPASGCEHMFSHIWEMEGYEYQGEPVSHGFQVSVGTVAAAKLQWFVANTPLDVVRKMAAPIPTAEARRAEMERLLVCDKSKLSLETAYKKVLVGKEAEERRELIYSKWTELGERLKQQLYPIEQIEKMLKDAGAPIHYTDIGMSREQFLHAPMAAQLIRIRYTILDLLYEIGVLKQAVDML